MPTFTRNAIHSTLLVLSFFLCGASHAQSAPKHEGKKGEHFHFDKIVQLTRQKDEFTLTLDANRTTGYQWILTRYDADYIKPIRYEYQPAKTNMLGAPGKSIWTFKAPSGAFSAPTLHRIKLIYARPWDLKPAKRYVVGVVND